ncbi:protein FAM187B-like isoform X2 [Ciona intestinalis]
MLLLCKLMLVMATIGCGQLVIGMNVTMLDYFTDEELKLQCLIPKVNNSIAQWNFRSYKERIRLEYFINNYTFSTVEVTGDDTTSSLYVSPLALLDAGRYDCVLSGRVLASWRVSVRSVDTMQYILTARGQAPWKDTTIRDKTIGLRWSPWTNCDGCAGNGERRRFGFCYVTWDEGSAHCDSREVPIMMRTLAKSRPEEIAVEVCYDQCSDKQPPMFVREQRILVKNGASVKFTCRQNASVRDAVRWEHNDVTVKRNDVSFGYVASKSRYVSKDNRFFFNNIHMPSGGTVRFACTTDRKRRIIFQLVVSPLATIDVASFIDHLRWMAITSAIQSRNACNNTITAHTAWRCLQYLI